MIRILAFAAAVLLAIPTQAQHNSHRVDKQSGHHGTAHGKGHHGGHHGKHARLDVPEDAVAPTVTLTAHRDGPGKRAFNLHIDVKNFAFDAANVGKTSSWKSGHAHLYVNGKKVTRLYGAWYFLDHLPPGPATVTVTLNSNTHQDLYYKGEQIADTITLE